MNLLLVEDDVALGQALHDVLTDSGYTNTWVRDAGSAQRFLESEDFDLALFDIVLPGESGLELLRWLRNTESDTPVLMITARDAVMDRVIGLDSGADDYLPKPFAIEEFLSRVRSLLRRRGPKRPALWLLGDLSIDTGARRVYRSGARVLLSRREFSILLMLAQRPGIVMTRAELARGSNANDLIDSNAVDFHIHSLRKKLGHGCICTVRGVGYFFDTGQ